MTYAACVPACLPGDSETVMCDCGAAHVVLRGELADPAKTHVTGHYFAVFAEHLGTGEQVDHHITVVIDHGSDSACCGTVALTGEYDGEQPAVEILDRLGMQHQHWAGEQITTGEHDRAGDLIAAAHAVLGADDRVREAFGLPALRSRLTIDPDVDTDQWICDHCAGQHYRVSLFIYEDDLPRAVYSVTWTDDPADDRPRLAYVDVSIGNPDRPEQPRTLFQAVMVHAPYGLSYSLHPDPESPGPALGAAMPVTEAREHPLLDLTWRICDLASETDEHVARAVRWVLAGPAVETAD